MSSVNSEFYFFFSNLDPFISLSVLIGVAKNYKAMLNSSAKSGHPCLVPDFRENSVEIPLKTGNRTAS